MRINPSTLAAVMTVMLAAVSTQAHDAGHGHDGALPFGEPGDPAEPAREIVLIMKEADGKMLFTPNKISVKKGEQIRFQVTNEGAIDHEFVLATLESNLKHAREMEKNPDMEHDEPNMKRLAPGTSAEVLWKFSKAGTFDFSCLIPGHRQAGMAGTVIVK
jgi:uncharacterized cupredoxin-like copper-binding protein